MRLNIQ